MSKVAPFASAPGDPRRSLGRVLDFIRLIWALDHGLTRVSKRMYRTIGLTGPQRFVLRLVGEFPRISAGGLAAALHVHPSTLTGVLRRLADHGLLDRAVDPLDGRRALFQLTQRGAQLNATQRNTVEGYVRTALGSVSEKDLVAAAHVLGCITEVLSEAR